MKAVDAAFCASNGITGMLPLSHSCLDMRPLRKLCTWS